MKHLRKHKPGCLKFVKNPVARMTHCSVYMTFKGTYKHLKTLKKTGLDI
jgi:hypothetical protein